LLVSAFAGVCRYEGLEPLLATLAENVIAPCGRESESVAGATALDRGGTNKASINVTRRGGDPQPSY
jgi:hypothetical protein